MTRQEVILVDVLSTVFPEFFPVFRTLKELFDRMGCSFHAVAKETGILVSNLEGDPTYRGRDNRLSFP